MPSAPVLDRGERAERARAARREEILAAARRVFAARGFRGTTIADIAEDAGIALGTIYLYFPAKDAILCALSERFGELMAQAGGAAPVGPTLAATVYRRIDRIFASCAENRDLVRLVVVNADPGTEIQRRMRAAEDMRDRPMVREIARSVDAGFVRSCDPVIATRLINGVVSMAVYQAFVLGDGEQADEFRDACAEMITAYLQPASTTVGRR